MKITRALHAERKRGSADYFTGEVWLEEVTVAPYASDVRVVVASFGPGARTAWHTHPLGQTLIVTAGSGRVQRWGGPVVEIRPGDVVWFPPVKNTGMALRRALP